MCMCVCVYIYIYNVVLVKYKREVSDLALWYIRKTASIHRHHPEGVVYGSVCLNSGTLAVSEITSCRWWCIKYVFPYVDSENATSSEIPYCQTPVGLSTCSMFGRALHRQPRVGSPQPQEKVPRPARMRHLFEWSLYSLPTYCSFRCC